MTRSKSTPLDLLQTMMRASISQQNCSLMRVSLSPLVVTLHPTVSNGGAPSLTQCNSYCRTRYGRSFSLSFSFSVNSYRLTPDVDPAPIGLPSQSSPNRFVPRPFAPSYPAATPKYLGLSSCAVPAQENFPGGSASSDVQRSPRVCSSSNTLAPPVSTYYKHAT